MKLLYLTHGCPYPPNKGDRIRSFNILKHIAKKHDIILVYPHFGATESQHKVKLMEYCLSIEEVPLNLLTARIRGVLGLFANQSITTSYFFSEKLRQALAEKEFDLALADCSSMAQYILHLSKPKIVDFVDVDSDKWRLYSNISPFPKSLIYRFEHRKLRNLENEMIDKFDFCLVVSDNEKRLLKDKKNIQVVRNGVDINYFKPVKGNHQENSLIFLGAMNYFPNVDGVLYFYEQILPLIKRRIHDVNFVIAGMNPVKKIKSLADSRTTVTGYVADIRAYMARAAVCIVPLRIAKGVQNKILEAMAMGIPVVATTLSNTGINAVHQKEIMLADTPEEFANVTTALLLDRARRQDMAQNAKRFVERNFTWEENMKQLDAVIDSFSFH